MAKVLNIILDQIIKDIMDAWFGGNMIYFLWGFKVDYSEECQRVL